MRKERKHYTAEEKVGVLRRHLLDKAPVSNLCEELGLQPTVFYRWQKEFFENGAAAFQSRGKFDRLPRTTAGFTLRALDGYGLRDHWPARPLLTPHYPVLVHRLALLLHASFRPRLATTPLRFAITSPPSGCEKDFHLQAVEHARHTKKDGLINISPSGELFPGSFLRSPHFFFFFAAFFFAVFFFAGFFFLVGLLTESSLLLPECAIGNGSFLPDSS